MKIPRVYRKYEEWEEKDYNMWGEVSNRNGFIEMATAFTGNHRLYGSYMSLVVDRWPVSCENALTDYSMNRKAWLGHAAVAMAFRCPEDITRAAWKGLTDEQRRLANAEAERTIKRWENDYRKVLDLPDNMEEEVL